MSRSVEYLHTAHTHHVSGETGFEGGGGGDEAGVVVHRKRGELTSGRGVEEGPSTVSQVN